MKGLNNSEMVKNDGNEIRSVIGRENILFSGVYVQFSSREFYELGQ